MSHWHIWRMECEFSRLAEDGAFSIDILCILQRYLSVELAFEGVREDVLRRFPDAGRFVEDSAGSTVSAESKVVYKVGSTHFVMWQLVACPGRCESVERLVELAVRDYLHENFGQRISINRRGEGA